MTRRARSIKLNKNKKSNFLGRVYFSPTFGDRNLVTPASADADYAVLDAAAKTNVLYGEFLNEPVDGLETFGNFRPIHNNSGNWGLDRIDQTNLPLDGKYHFTRVGGGIDVVIVSSGILPNHKEFLLTQGTTRVDTIYDYRFNLPPNHPDYLDFSDPNWQRFYGADFVGHGTHLASIVGGSNVGVAKGVNLWSVKIFNELFETDMGRFVSGLEAVLNWHTTKTSGNPTVLLLTFSDFIVDDDIDLRSVIMNLYNAGVSIISTAGNFNKQVADSPPASYPEVFAVGGSDRNDRFMNPINPNDGSWNLRTSDTRQGSNFGDLDLIAPGHDIRGAWVSLDLRSRIIQPDISPIGEYANISGNSVAAAFAAGVAALYLDGNPGASPSDVYNFLRNSSSRDKIRGLSGLETPNRLLRSIYSQVRFRWDTPEGRILDVSESSPVETYLSAVMIDSDSKEVDVEFSIDSGSLPSGVFLESRTGRIFGNTPEISVSSPGYTLISELSEQEQSFYSDTQTGFVDYTFSVLAETTYGVDTRDFVIRVVDNNNEPVWDTQQPVLLNNLVSADYFKYKNTVNLDLQSYPYVVDMDGDDITFTLLNGDLPPGLVLVSSGLIQGTVGAIYPETITFETSAGTIYRTYQFTVRASDSFESVDRLLEIEVFRDSTNDTAPNWVTFAWDANSIGDFFQGQAVDLQLVVDDPDGDSLLFGESSISDPTVPSANSVNIFWNTPPGITVTPSGRFQGVFTIDDAEGDYYFNVRVSDGWKKSSQVMLFTVSDIDISVLNATASMDWVTEPGNLGEMEETYESTFFVQASTILNKDISYSLIPGAGNLPTGLSLDSNTGLIYGKASPVPVDTTYTFSIRASLVGLSSSFIEGEFSITVKNVWTQDISQIDFKISGLDRYEWYQTVSNVLPSVLNRSTWYRESDYNFSDNWEPFIYIAGGMPVLTESQLVGLLSVQSVNSFPGFPPTYWAPIRVLMGDLKTAVARDLEGNILYEVIYYEILDPNKNVRASEYTEEREFLIKPIEDGVSPVETLPLGQDTVAEDNYINQMPNIYPSSILNWRGKIFEDLGFVNNIERLPRWMKSEQVLGDPSSVLGYIPSVVLVYLKPGTAQNFINILQFINPGILKRGQIIDIDRIIYSEILNPNSPKQRIIKFPPGDIYP